MLISENELVFVAATRLQGTKNGRDYDFAKIEISDGIGSLEIPIQPALAQICNDRFARGEKIRISVDVRKQFGRTQFIVDDVQSATG